MASELKLQDIKKLIYTELRECHRYVDEPAAEQIARHIEKEITAYIAETVKNLWDKLQEWNRHIEEQQIKPVREDMIYLKEHCVDKEYFTKTITELQLNLTQMVNEMRGMVLKDTNEKTGLDKPISGMQGPTAPTVF
ncbi:MAG: hypothetical protein A2445_05750 [Candidatus Jacksonbacteria bacterium RIFOXYC2_FULL_44_29]|nr:MAG: hypothetical protein UW45_C0008G0030 [Parcubacteria group bacterium GW2011_GWC2_44_22]OGY76015.1 MAG: hypothetical protein A2240_05595 [Candidatus Jacksonbacteria bacterium RIFOXYA2_FULL_43_12]OGY76781.1 MAG: hypothetical protein A2295_00395 [Candidatus Jacksonbacteria bacterium RIFOXYB2_FULL_44_15]OGY79188.1 MAG: hypothetical protein A2445_05750 [Candidatus Jacksonbacteria bacterium RIFOXYC2_FULL_44_29]OGY82093.1 MAG: hypothetical protein A2550_00130 [Candidatus Jacksonbacteria bacteri